MSGSKKCPCGLHYIAQGDRFCWMCRMGLDPRGPGQKEPFVYPDEWLLEKALPRQTTTRRRSATPYTTPTGVEQQDGSA